MANIEFIHPLLEKHKKQIQLTQDVFNGSDTAASYLYSLPQEATETFEIRVDKVTLKNYVRRSVEAMVGMIYRKPIATVGYSTTVNDYFKSIDLHSTLNQYSRDITQRLIRDGSVYILVDSAADINRPYFIAIDRQDVINWKKDIDGNFTQLVVREQSEDQIDDFAIEYTSQYRVYDNKGNITIYREASDGSHIATESVSTGLDYIPVVELFVDAVPPMYDIARLNLKHMNRTSIKDRYLDMAATPVPVIWGADIDEEGSVNSAKPALVIGVDEAFLFNGSKDEADFQWRELSGSSIDQLQQDLSVIEDEITTGVIRATSADTTTTKTATQSYYEASEASNRVTVLANIVEYGINNAINMLKDYMSDLEEGYVKINKDYISIASNGQDSRLLWEVYLGGAISYETFIQSLQKQEIVDIPSIEDEIVKIENDDFKPEPLVEVSDNKMSDNRTPNAEDIVE